MAWNFGIFRLDPDRHELTRDGVAVRVEPQVFAVLAHLVRHGDRVVGKDELADAVWAGADVSDASIASRIRSARAALGDDGTRQEMIRTVHGVGFRFVAAVADEGEMSSALSGSGPVHGLAKPAGNGPNPAADRMLGRPSIAILPLRMLSVDDGLAVLAEAIPHEIILALSRLAWVAVTARGSSFRFGQGEPDFSLIAASLAVRYVLSGVLETTGRKVSVTLELTDCENAEVIWADRLTTGCDEVEALRAMVVGRIVAALELRVPQNEARLALSRGSDDFDAWANYHLGLRHLYRFTAADNALAATRFARAVALDPGFARAEAGLSFTSFIDAFLRLTPDVAAARQAARRHAERGLELDPMDPFVNFTMGRAHWLTDEVEAAQHWLGRATTINPNYAQGYYASAFTSMLRGDAAACEAGVQSALELSPLDPLLYGMYGVRAQMLMQQGDYAAAARWGEKAAMTPGAHHLIAMVATAACALAGDAGQAKRWSEAARAKRKDVRAADYTRAFPVRDQTARREIERVLRHHGF